MCQIQSLRAKRASSRKPLAPRQESNLRPLG
jgi:hypothetical protein